MKLNRKFYHIDLSRHS